MEVSMFLYHRQFFDLKELIESEKYGEMLFVEASFGFPRLSKDDIRYSKPETYESKIRVKNNGKVIEEIASGEDNNFINMLKVLSNLSKGRLLKGNANTFVTSRNAKCY
jgi:hypothetical protein